MSREQEKKVYGWMAVTCFVVAVVSAILTTRIESKGQVIYAGPLSIKKIDKVDLTIEFGR